MFLTVSCTRESTSSDKITIHANTLSEVLNGSVNYRLISEQLAKVRYNTLLYGYPSIVRVSDKDYFISYTERFKDEDGVEQAYIYQSYINFY